MQMIQPNFGRRAILTLIVIGAVLSAICLTWIGYGGKISPENMNSAIRDLAEYYSPLLMILAGFYFSEIENILTLNDFIKDKVKIWIYNSIKYITS
jgi:hypothetical protein